MPDKQMSEAEVRAGLKKFAKYQGRPGYVCKAFTFDLVYAGDRVVKYKTGTGAITTVPVTSLFGVRRSSFRKMFQVFRVSEVEYFD
jgi:hypothetical protein